MISAKKYSHPTLVNKRFTGFIGRPYPSLLSRLLSPSPFNPPPSSPLLPPSSSPLLPPPSTTSPHSVVFVFSVSSHGIRKHILLNDTLRMIDILRRKNERGIPRFVESLTPRASVSAVPESEGTRRKMVLDSLTIVSCARDIRWQIEDVIINDPAALGLLCTLLQENTLEIDVNKTTRLFGAASCYQFVQAVRRSLKSEDKNQGVHVKEKFHTHAISYGGNTSSLTQPLEVAITLRQEIKDMIKLELGESGTQISFPIIEEYHGIICLLSNFWDRGFQLTISEYPRSKPEDINAFTGPPETGTFFQTSLPMSVCGAFNPLLESSSVNDGENFGIRELSLRAASAGQQYNKKTPLRICASSDKSLNSEDYQAYNANIMNEEAVTNVDDTNHGTKIDEKFPSHDTSDGGNINSLAQVLDATATVTQQNKGKPNLKKLGMSGKQITLADIECYLGKTKLPDAAANLGVSKSTLKRRCRELGIPDWRSNKISKGEHSPCVNSIHASGGRLKRPITTMQEIPPSVGSVSTATPACNSPHEATVKSVTVKARYEGNTVKFVLPISSKLNDLVRQVKKRINLEAGEFSIKYKDEDDDLISLICDDDWQYCMHTMGSQAKIEMLIEPCND